MNVGAHRSVLRSLVGLFGTLAAGRGHAGERPLRRASVALALGMVTVLALCAGVAQAEPPKLISYGQFVSEGPGVAVDNSAGSSKGDVYVAGLFTSTFGQGHIYKYDSSGKLISPPSPFGEAYYAGAAVSPANGDVYVLGQEGLFTPTTLYTYDPNSGALLSSFEVPASPNVIFFTDVQIAADSAGNVYVPEPLKKKEKSPVGSGEFEYVPNDEVLEYSPGGTLLKTFTGSGPDALKEPTGVAVDSSGNLWVAGDNRIVEVASSGAPVEVNGKPVEIKSEGVGSVALDGHGDVFAVVANSADPCGEMGSSCVHLVEYSSEGRQLADVGAGSFGTPGAGATFANMVAVNEASGRVYVTDRGKETFFGHPEEHPVWMFGPPTAPGVDKEFTAEVGVSEAKLGALVNPGGLQTGYRFEYGPTSAYGSSTPFPEGSVGEGITARAVWASANGLAPGTTYHYRVVATNELGTVYGPDRTFTALTAEQAACPNEQLRGGFSARLPDCRAYELVTPPVKSSAQFDGAENVAYSSMAATDGEALTLFTYEPRPGAPTGGQHYVATRGAGGWIAESIMPIESYDGVGCQDFKVVYAYSDQLTKDVIETGGGSRTSLGAYPENAQSCNPEGRQVVSGEPVGYQNLLVRDNKTRTYQLANTLPPGVTPADAHFQGASADLSHVFFTETSPLAEGASYGVENLYEWDEGAPLRLVSVLPDGTAVAGSVAGMSNDGSRVLFTYGGALYDRIDGQRTIQIDEKQGVSSGPSGGGSFKAATPDGSKVFFLDESKLTPGSTAAAVEPDLYECALPEGASKCELSDLTVAPAGEHADVLHVTPLGRHDSSYVYFIAAGVLASGAEAGKQNLYLWNGEKTTFIATIANHAYESVLGLETSPDGKWLSFQSEKSLTGYDSTPAGGGGCGESVACRELFLYNAASGQIICASCNPSGEAPVGSPAGLKLSDSGRIFFQTTDALVPSDTNGQLDVYEYENGQPSLISSGTSSSESNLEDVSESGDDVFFRSYQRLVPQDTQEGMIVIYDARVAGGFPSPSSPPLCTTADACREAPSPQPLIFGAPSSATFSGPGNVTPSAAKSKAKPKAKPVKCKRRRNGSRRGEKRKCVRKKSKQARKTNNDRRAK